MKPKNTDHLAKPLASYSHTRTIGNIVYIAGQGCRDPISNIWAGVSFDESGKVNHIDFKAQVHGVFRNIEQTLATEGMTKTQIVDVHVFLTNLSEQFSQFNEIWNDFFAGVATPPTRTTIGVKELPGLNLVEMKVIASKS